jgi:XTP/dITP diphosphohydrolase
MEYVEDRRAYFVCVLCLLMEGLTHFFRGEVHGILTKEPAGKLGFGYDPVFIPNGFSSTFAQMPPEEKNSISHRGRALQALSTHFNRML